MKNLHGVIFNNRTQNGLPSTAGILVSCCTTTTSVSITSVLNHVVWWISKTHIVSFDLTFITVFALKCSTLQYNILETVALSLWMRLTRKDPRTGENVRIRTCGSTRHYYDGLFSYSKWWSGTCIIARLATCSSCCWWVALSSLGRWMKSVTDNNKKDCVDNWLAAASYEKHFRCNDPQYISRPSDPQTPIGAGPVPINYLSEPCNTIRAS